MALRYLRPYNLVCHSVIRSIQLYMYNKEATDITYMVLLIVSEGLDRHGKYGPKVSDTSGSVFLCCENCMVVYVNPE
jgi:hypothetical protein